jgi:hypothetical protein
VDTKSLLNHSANAAQRAIRHYLNKEHDQFLIQAAVSFELLGKAKLVAIHPSLVVDKDFDSLLHACAAGKHSKRPPWSIKTITATEVLNRCTQLQPELGGFAPRLKLLAEFRNSTIHLGEAGEAESRELFHAFLGGGTLIGDGMGIQRKDLFGEFSDLVATHLDESAAEANRRVAEKLAQAKDTFHQRYAALHAEQLQAIVSIVEKSYQLDKYEDELIVCPACGNLGMVSGLYDVDWEADYDDETGMPTNAYPIVTLKPSQFVCNLCDLTLDDVSELKAAGLDESLNIEDVDPEDFYEEIEYP